MSLKVSEGGIRFAERGSTGKSVEGLEPFDRIALDTSAQTVPHDLIQIDEQTGAEHPVDLFLACRIAAHQALQGRRLVWGVMIDMQTGELRPPCHDEIDELLEGALFVGARERPVTFI